MYPEERQQAIAALVITQGRASVTELAQTYDVTTETVRRDLAVLDRAGVVRRVHGGAVPVRALHLVEPGVGERETTRADHKDAIAARRRRVLPAERRQRAVRRGHHHRADRRTCCRRTASCVVVTNSVPIAARLAGMPSVSLQLLGGRVRGLTQAAVGEQALRRAGHAARRHRLHRHQRHQRAARPVHPRQRRGRRQARDGRAAPTTSWWSPTRPRSAARTSSASPRSPASTPSSPTPRSAPPTAPQLSRAGRRGHLRRRSRMIVTVTPNPSIDRTVTLPRAADPRRRAPGHVGDQPSRAARASTSPAR